MAIGKRMRFEILKRDGFRCYYCGTAPVSTPLHVDHVIPVSKGGTDDPENLISACRDCNLGKSNKMLNESAIDDRLSAEELEEQADQIRAYMYACRELEVARDDMKCTVAMSWYARFIQEASDSLCLTTLRRLDRLTWDEVLEAMDYTAARNKRKPLDHPERYFLWLLADKHRERGGE